MIIFHTLTVSHLSTLQIPIIAADFLQSQTGRVSCLYKCSKVFFGQNWALFWSNNFSVKEYRYSQEHFIENGDQCLSTFSSFEHILFLEHASKMVLFSCKHLHLLEASGALFLEHPYSDKRSQNKTFSITITSGVYFLKLQMMAWSVLSIFQYFVSLFYKPINWQSSIVISVTPSGKVISIF